MINYISSNQSVKMTVFINNAPDIHGGQSPLDDNDAVSVTVNDATPDFEGRNPGTNEFVFTIKPLEEIKNDQLHVIFNLKDKAGNEIMPVPKTREELLVHLCDYIASRNFLNVSFEENEIADSVDRQKVLKRTTK